MQDATSRPVLELREVRRTFKQGDREIPVLTGAEAELYPGQAIALVGPSGAGKSTLLHIAGLLETPDGGRVLVNGVDCARLSDARAHARAPAGNGLRLPIPSTPAGVYRARERANAAADRRQRPAGRARRGPKQLLDMLGLGHRLEHRPAQLSGGEQQRAAIARALANAPKLLLADEPTGNLDPHTSAHVFHELLELIRHSGVAALIATHNLALAKRMHRVLVLEAGRLQEVALPACRARERGLLGRRHRGRSGLAAAAGA